MITREQFATLFPGLSLGLQEDYYRSIKAAMEEFGIDTFQRVSAFLAQIGHETGGLHFLEELGGPSYFTKLYEHRIDLGNQYPGDGAKYHGRGMIQLTGRANYRDYGNLLGIPLETQPELASSPKAAARIAAAFWHRRGLNQLADVDQFQLITRRINGGLNGLEDRIHRWVKAREVVGLPPGIMVA